MGTDAQPCADSFAFFTSTPLVVQQTPARRLLVVIPVRRVCCSWQCESSARVTYFTAPTSSAIQPARAGVDFVESRGTALFEEGQQRAQLAVEVLPALLDDWKNPRAFAVVLEAPANASVILRASTEIIVEPTLAPKSTSISAASPLGASYTMVGLLAAAGLVVLVACWLRVRRCSLPRRTRAFEYKSLLLPRRNSEASEDTRDTSVSAGGSPVKSGVRRTACRVRPLKEWKAVTERHNSSASDYVVPEAEGATTTVNKREKGLSEDADDESELERDLREHLAFIQGRQRST